MVLNEDDNNLDTSDLPFAHVEIATDVHLDRPNVQTAKYKNIKKKPKKSKLLRSNDTIDKKRADLSARAYFENMSPENNFIKLIPYTGPCNTSHLGKSLLLPQLVSKDVNDSKSSVQRFIQDYENAIKALTSNSDSSEAMTISVFLRFGISYILQLDTATNQFMSLRDYFVLRNRGKAFKTAFYTCKGVTSPKRLLTTMTKLNYHQISSNKYSYDVQLYGVKNNVRTVVHFQYDEQFHCLSIYFRQDHPINFDFIRNKTSSIFCSIDDSYADIFDFRIQLSHGKILSRTDPIVLNALHDVPIDEVLFMDSTTHVLRIAPKLQKFVKYLKSTRSSSYQIPNEPYVIHIGTYEEFQLNNQCQVELVMKASNMMTIESLESASIQSGKTLYDIGIWFSTLCQSCVDLSATRTGKMDNKSCKWFASVLGSRKKYNRSMKQMDVTQLTTYKAQKSKKTYTNEELAFVRRILREENLRDIFLNGDVEKPFDRKHLEGLFQDIMKRLKKCAAPSTDYAMKKVERAYQLVCEELIES